MTKLRKSTFKHVESEVYDLQETLSRIDLIRHEILHGTHRDVDSPQPGRNSVRAITNESEQKATLLVEHKQLRRMEKVTSAILKVYDGLIDEKQQLIKLYYWKRPGELTWDGVSKELNISRRTAIRWRKAFIYGIAKELGER